jgi:hypothetical protein
MPPTEHHSGWPDHVDQILRGDHVVALAYATPASGVVLVPLTNTGLWDRERGAGEPVTSSIGAWRKFRRIERSPRVAFAYHTREHGLSDRPDYVLVQGRAHHSPVEDRTWIERNLETWERLGGPRDVGPLWERYLRIYHWRVAMQVEVERVIVWPDLACEGRARVHGPPLPADPPKPQEPPARGTEPRIRHRRATRRAAGLANVLLGWVGSDGYPFVVPVAVEGTEAQGIVLTAPSESVGSGGRRAGLLAHSFARYTYGQNQRKHTGWLEASGDRRLLYAPHTEAGYHLPRSRFLYRLAAGFVTRRGYRAARRAGFVNTAPTKGST